MIVRHKWPIKKLWDIGVHRAYSSISACKKTATNNPVDFCISDIGKFYDVTYEEAESLIPTINLPSAYAKQYKTLGELSWMCRHQLLDGINCLRTVETSMNALPLRLVMWGKFGTGKSMTLMQLCHYCAKHKWVVLHARSVMDWTRKPKEIQMSNFKQGRVDTPFEAQAILRTFKLINVALWPILSEIKSGKTYEWSKLEKTTEESPITDIVEVGLKSQELASDCVGALINELKQNATAGKFKLFVAIDEANSMFFVSKIRQFGGKYVTADNVTLSVQMKKLISTDWRNGACLLIAEKKEFSDSRDKLTIPVNTPLKLFGEEAFEFIEPFVPIETSGYTMAEISNAYAYYRDKNWIATESARSDMGKQQLMHLSGFNPYNFERMCAFV